MGSKDAAALLRNLTPKHRSNPCVIEPCLCFSRISIPVSVRLVGSCDWDTNVVCLVLGQHCELCAERTQMETGHLLVQLLRKEVHIVLVLLSLLPVLEQIKLCKCLVCEGARHDK